MDVDRWLLAKRWADGNVVDVEDHVRLNRIPLEENPGYRLLTDLPTELQNHAEREAADVFGPFSLMDVLSDRETARAEYYRMRLDTLMANHKEYAVRTLYDLLARFGA